MIKNIRRLIKYLNKRMAVNILIAAFLASVCEILYPLLWMSYIDTLSSESMGEDSAYSLMFWKIILGIPAVYLIVKLVNISAVSFRLINEGNLRADLYLKLRKVLYRKWMKLSFSYYDRHNTGSLFTRIIGDVNRAVSIVIVYLTGGFTSIISFFLIACIFFYYNGTIGLYILIFIPLLSYVAYLGKKKIMKYSSATAETNDRFTVEVSENLDGIEINRSTHTGKYANEILSQINKELRRVSFLSNTYYSTYSPLVITVSSLTVVLIIYMGGNLISSGDAGITLGVWVAMFGYTRNIFQPILNGMLTYGISQQNVSSSERIFQFLETEEYANNGNQLVHKANTGKHNITEGSINISQVSFGYDPEKIIFSSLNLSIRKNEKVALIGPTGAGKTTIINLISRLYEPQAGMITVDGINIRDIPINSYADQVGILLQTPFIFSGSVYNNLIYGNKNVDETRILSLLEEFSAFHLIPKLHDQIHNNGENLSLGEKQLISIIRLLLKNPKIVMIDEFSSSIDILMEKNVNKSLEKLVQNRTSIIIAHKLYTIRNSDRILIIKDGAIHGQGNHNDLIRNNEYYRMLINTKYK